MICSSKENENEETHNTLKKLAYLLSHRHDVFVSSSRYMQPIDCMNCCHHHPFSSRGARCCHIVVKPNKKMNYQKCIFLKNFGRGKGGRTYTLRIALFSHKQHFFLHFTSSWWLFIQKYNHWRCIDSTHTAQAAVWFGFNVQHFARRVGLQQCCSQPSRCHARTWRRLGRRR